MPQNLARSFQCCSPHSSCCCVSFRLGYYFYYSFLSPSLCLYRSVSLSLSRCLSLFPSNSARQLRRGCINLQLSNPFYTSLAFQDFYFLARCSCCCCYCSCCCCCCSCCACVARVAVQAALVACRAACFGIPNACLCFPSVRFGFGFMCVSFSYFLLFLFLSATVCTRWQELGSWN